MLPAGISTHRAYVFIDSRKVHYRRWGNGPVVLMLHGSPQSSCAMARLAEFFARQGFCAIAPDTPANGLSDSLANSAHCTIRDYARALIEFADALGIERFAVYGFHTGAAIATVSAACYPDRITGLLCEGLSAWQPEERKQLLDNYMPAFDIKWDGSHLCWLWARLEHQQLFFPWYTNTPENRMDFNLSSPRSIHINAMDWLAAGENYHHPYQAAFNFNTAEWLHHLNLPHLFATMRQDPLSSHLSRDEFNHSHSQVFEDPASMWLAFSEFLQQRHGDHVTQLVPKVSDHSLQSGWVGDCGSAIAWRGNLNSKNGLPPLVLVHNAGGSKTIFEELLSSLAQHRKVLAFDLPGHGDSDQLDDGHRLQTVAALGQEIAAACHYLGLTNYIVIGYELGAQIAAWMVKAKHAIKGGSLGRNAIPEQHRSQWQQRYSVDLSPQWDGTHLIRAFRIARWEALYYPWFERIRTNTLKFDLELNPKQVHQRAINLLQANQSWREAVKAEAEFDWADHQNLGSRFCHFETPFPAPVNQAGSIVCLTTLMTFH